MSEAKTLPTNPDHAPMKVRTNMEYVRHAFYELSSLADEVTIEFEPTDDACGCDDSDGKWNVYTRKGGNQFEARSEYIENALWYVLEHLTAKDRSDWENRERKKREALAKLSHDERRLLHLE
jgi:hypothetical protein